MYFILCRALELALKYNEGIEKVIASRQRFLSRVGCEEYLDSFMEFKSAYKSSAHKKSSKRKGAKSSSKHGTFFS